MAFPTNKTPLFKLNQPSTKDSITFRPFTVKESKSLLMAASSNVDSMQLAMEAAVDNCTFNILDVPNLPAFDLEYMFVQIRGKSVGESIDLTVTCNNCKEKEDHTININDVNVIHDPDHNKKIMLSENLGVIMKYPTTRQLEYLTLHYNTETVFNTLLDCIETVFTDVSVTQVKDESREELLTFVESLTNDQMNKIEEFFRTIPKLKHEFGHTCGKCGTKNKYTMVGLENFFA
jgi:hypothetical protein